MCGVQEVLGGAMPIVGLYQQDQAAKAANEAAEAQYEAEHARMLQEKMDRENQMSADARAEADKMSAERSALALDALRSKAAAKVAGAESGAGSSVSRIRSFISEELGEDLASGDLDAREENIQFGIQQRARGIQTAAINRSQNAFITRKNNQRKRASATDYGLAAIQGGLDAYSKTSD